MSTETYDHLNDENRNWLKDLNFFQDEIKYLQNKIAEYASTGLSSEKAKVLLDYKKKFLSKLQKIDDLRHLIFVEEKHLAERMELATRLKLSVDEDHHSLKERIENFTGDYQLMKEEFNSFLSSCK